MRIKQFLSSCAVILSLTTFTTLSFPDDSEARRIGGRSSIGRTVSPSTTQKPATTSNINQQQRQNTNQVGNTATMNRGGMFGGMLGGLLAGTLLGSLLMGGGFAGTGIIDIILLGLVAFFVIRFFKSRSQRQENQNNVHRNYQTNQYSQTNNAHNSWDHLSSARNSSANNVQDHADNTMDDFNADEFVAGAKTLYIRMQEAWDERDLEDIKNFTSKELYDEIERQKQEDPNPSKTEILLLQASVVDRQVVGNQEYVAVLFDTMLREDQTSQASEQVKEIWNFAKTKDSNENWKLDGIQQL